MTMQNTKVELAMYFAGSRLSYEEGEPNEMGLTTDREAFEYYIASEGGQSQRTWTAANRLVIKLLNQKRPRLRELLDVATRMLRQGRDSELIMQGELLHHFHKFMHIMLPIWHEFQHRLGRAEQLQRRTSEFVNLFETFPSFHNISTDDALPDTATALMQLGHHMQAFGHFSKAEALLEKALDLYEADHGERIQYRR